MTHRPFVDTGPSRHRASYGTRSATALSIARNRDASPAVDTPARPESHGTFTIVSQTDDAASIQSTATVENAGKFLVSRPNWLM
jgi:hypothetical protein